MLEADWFFLGFGIERWRFTWVGEWGKVVFEQTRWSKSQFSNTDLFSRPNIRWLEFHDGDGSEREFPGSPSRSQVSQSRAE